MVPPAHAITTDLGSLEPTYSANTPPGFSENIILLFGVLQQVFVVFDIFLTFDYWLKDVEVLHAILVRDKKQTNVKTREIWAKAIFEAAPDR